ncbi:hypothetical protein OV203_28600 [Nannocystis sp. ILAH1]|uniref:hypothetical protein n=1 Tax=unclassified Nannocystis TaxID=2627009 RepID=UPI0022709EA1|nr:MULTISPECIES: hypothetical protein [unclassified Nannocystis]MCY0991139.1 hypothetical protein [Nannocystis sp. ILAH1]MCY1064653.1 hypothetical protein [Nannocystis sp. RBIL2]
MSETPSSSGIVGGVDADRAADVVRGAARRLGMSVVAGDDATRKLPAGVLAFELTWIGSRARLGGVGELTVDVHASSATAAAVFAALSAETGGFVLSESVGAWYAGHSMAFDPLARESSLAKLLRRLSWAPDLLEPHAITTERMTWTLLGVPRLPRMPDPFACAVFPLVNADEFAGAWAREAATATAGWAWRELLAPPLDVACAFVMLRRGGRGDPELIERLVRSLDALPAAAFELFGNGGMSWWIAPSHPCDTEPLHDVAALIEFLRNASIMMGTWPAAMAWPMD